MAFVCHSITIAELKEAYINITVNTTSVKSKIEYYEEEDSSTVNATAFSDISEDEPVKVAEKNETG